ncbi:unnamed protein product [Mortierella alpina]
MFPQKHSVSPTLFAAPVSSPSPSPSATSASPAAAQATLIKTSPVEPTLQYYALQDQYPAYPPQPYEDPNQHQQIQQQRFLLQQQQQQAQQQLHNLQIKQKKKLLEDQQQRLQQLQHQHQHQQQQYHGSNITTSSLSPSHQPLFVTTPSGTQAFPSSQPSAVYNPLASLQQPLSATSQQQQQQQQQQHFLPNSSSSTTDTSTVDVTAPSSSLISASGPAMTASMDILVPFPMHQRNSFDSSPLMLQQAMHPMKALSIQEQQQQQQQQQQQLENSMFFHPLKYESAQSRSTSMSIDSTVPGGTALSGFSGANQDLNSYTTNGWANPNMAMLGPGSPDLLRRLSYSSGASDMSVQLTGFAQEMAGYNLNARIIRKKDQLDELSPSGAIVAAPVVDEVRTGQQFLIKLQLTKQGGVPPSAFPTMRVERREAINTAGEPKADAEPLTLQIIVHLAKSGQIRKGACAKCCHKYGPSSPILVLLDPLSPSITDPSSYAHVDTSSGSATILAKVMCSSTDHGERGNKDQYVFEFRLKRTSSMPNAISRMNMSPMGADFSDDDGETIAVCSTAPIMCSGHHKAKRVYPSQRPSKVTKDGPVPKTKTIKHHKSVPNAAGSHQVSSLGNSDSKEDYFRSGSVSGSSSYPSPMSFMQDNITSSSLLSNFGDDQLSDFDLGGSINTSDYNNNNNGSSMIQQQQQQPLMSSSESPSGAGHPSTQAPKVFEVRPDRGPIRKTTDVVLRGLFFCDGMVPYFGCFPAQDIVVETSNLIICKAPESPLPGTVPITIYDSMGASFADLGQFTYTDDSETELLILQIQLRLAHRALEYLHTQATGQRGNANEILREIPGLAQSPRSAGGSPGGNTMAAGPLDAEEEFEPTMLTLEQVEDGLLKTLNNLPVGMDISIQLEDQSNLLHLSILLGFDRLTLRLIEEGCELDTLDAYAMTPLMYAVIKGDELVARALVIAGAASSGAKTPREFYAMLPRPIVPTPAMVSYLSVSCTRHSTTSRVLVASTARRGPVMIEIENDEGSISSDSELDNEDEESETAEVVSEDISTPSTVQNVPAIIRTSPSEDATSLDQLAHTIRGMHVNANMAPLAQQGLPPMHVVDADGSVTVNNHVLKVEETLRGDLHGAETIATTNDESGYHSGIISEVQDRLSYMSHSALPAEGVTMSVHFNRAASSVKPSSPSTPTPDNLFRTGDSFGIEIRLATLPGSNMSLPTEFLGVRFPYEMVKRVNGRPASILKEMAYDLKMSIELGKSNVENLDVSSSDSTLVHDHQGDGIELKSACQACARFLHEHKKISPSRMSPEDPSAYPILQFSVPTPSTVLMAQGSASPLEIDRGTGIMEVRNGHVEVKARVNCSSLHPLIQREKAKRTAALRLQQQQQGAASSSSTSATKMQLDMKDLEDPGFVFSFELVHPTLQTVVARFQTGPILFQSYSRGRS